MNNYTCSKEQFLKDVKDQRSEATGLELSDFWECSSEVYTYHFIWCLWAIAWGIRQYDDAKSASQEAQK